MKTTAGRRSKRRRQDAPFGDGGADVLHGAEVRFVVAVAEVQAGNCVERGGGGKRKATGYQSKLDRK